jgi:hypothetical protein
MSFAFFSSRFRAARRRVGAVVEGALRGVWQARMLLVLVAGAACVTTGAAMVFPPAGWIVGGVLLIAGALPDREVRREHH